MQYSTPSPRSSTGELSSSVQSARRSTPVGDYGLFFRRPSSVAGSHRLSRFSFPNSQNLLTIIAADSGAVSPRAVDNPDEPATPRTPAAAEGEGPAPATVGATGTFSSPIPACTDSSRGDSASSDAGIINLLRRHSLEGGATSSAASLVTNPHDTPADPIFVQPGQDRHVLVSEKGSPLGQATADSNDAGVYLMDNHKGDGSDDDSEDGTAPSCHEDVCALPVVMAEEAPAVAQPDQPKPPVATASSSAARRPSCTSTAAETKGAAADATNTAGGAGEVEVPQPPNNEDASHGSGGHVRTHARETLEGYVFGAAVGSDDDNGDNAPCPIQIHVSGVYDDDDDDDNDEHHRTTAVRSGSKDLTQAPPPKEKRSGSSDTDVSAVSAFNTLSLLPKSSALSIASLAPTPSSAHGRGDRRRSSGLSEATFDRVRQTLDQLTELRSGLLSSHRLRRDSIRRVPPGGIGSPDSNGAATLPGLTSDGDAAPTVAAAPADPTIDEVIAIFLSDQSSPTDVRLKQVVQLAKELFQIVDVLEQAVQRSVLMNPADRSMFSASVAELYVDPPTTTATALAHGSATHQPPTIASLAARGSAMVAPLQPIRRSSLGVPSAPYLGVIGHGASPNASALDLVSPSRARMLQLLSGVSGGGGGDRRSSIPFGWCGGNDGTDSPELSTLALNGSHLQRSHREQFREDGGFEMINDYMILEELGRGATGAVYLAMHQHTEAAFAIKSLAKVRNKGQNRFAARRVSAAASDAGSDGPTATSSSPAAAAVLSPVDAALHKNPVEREIGIMRRLKHPNLISLHEVIDDDDEQQIHLVMDYCRGGPIITVKSLASARAALGAFLSPRSARAVTGGGFETSVIRPLAKLSSYAAQICDALRYLHRLNIVHRDIKPDNILIADDDVVRITDFGESALLAKLSEDDPSFKRTVGTPAFFAPELCVAGSDTGAAPGSAPSSNTVEFFSSTGKEADVWAFGVTMYCALVGRFPFRGGSFEEQCRNILEDQVYFPALSDLCENVNVDGTHYAVWKDAISRMLEKQPKKRITLRELSRHPALAGIASATNEVLQHILAKHGDTALRLPQSPSAAATSGGAIRRKSLTSANVEGASSSSSHHREGTMMMGEYVMVIDSPSPSASSYSASTSAKFEGSCLAHSTITVATLDGSQLAEDGGTRCPREEEDAERDIKGPIAPSPPKSQRPQDVASSGRARLAHSSEDDDSAWAASAPPPPNRKQTMRSVTPAAAADDDEEDAALQALRNELYGEGGSDVPSAASVAAAGGSSHLGVEGLNHSAVTPLSSRNAARIVFVSEQKLRSVMHQANCLGIGDACGGGGAGLSRRQSLMGLLHK